MVETRTPARRRIRHDDAPDTTAEFQRAARLPDGPEKRCIQQHVVAAWLPMAHRLAGRYRRRGEDLEDLRQVAALALVKAVERYDPERGYAFESYAVPTITGELKRHFRDNTWDLHVPRRVQHLRNQVRASWHQLDTVLDRAPTVAELAEHSGLSQDDVQLGLEALHGFNSLSLEAEMPTGDGEGFRLLDTLADDEDGYAHVVDREAVKTRLRDLPEREQYILYLRFFRELTQSQIAERIGISQMHVSRLLTRSCARVREEIEAVPDQENVPVDV